MGDFLTRQLSGQVKKNTPHTEGGGNDSFDFRGYRVTHSFLLNNQNEPILLSNPINKVGRKTAFEGKS